MRWVDAWSSKPLSDCLIGGTAVVAYLAARQADVSPAVVLDSDGRSAVYQTLVAIAVGVLAFVIIPASIILALTPGERLRALMDHHARDFRSATVHSAYLSIAVAAVGLAGLALDTGRSWSPIRYAALGVAIALFLAVIRLVDQFSVLLKVIAADRDSEKAFNDFGTLKEIPLPDLPEGSSVEVQPRHRRGRRTSAG